MSETAAHDHELEVLEEDQTSPAARGADRRRTRDVRGEPSATEAPDSPPTT